MPPEGAQVYISSYHRGYYTEASYIHNKVDTTNPKALLLHHIAKKQDTLEIAHLKKNVGT